MNRYYSIQNLLKLSLYELNNVVKTLSYSDILLYFARESMQNLTIIFYRLNEYNKSKLLRYLNVFRRYINDLELKSKYMSRVKPVLIFCQNARYSDIIMELTSLRHDEFIKEFIVLVDDEYKFVGITYITDILSRFKYHDNNQKIKPHYCCYLTYNKKYNKKDQIIDEDALIDIHHLIVTDKSGYILGAVNIDYVFDYSDIYSVGSTNELYAVPIKDFNHITTIVAANLSGKLLTSIFAILVSLNIYHFVLMNLIECVIDILVLLIVEDEISVDSIIKYLSYMISIFACSITIIYSIIYSLKMGFLYGFVIALMLFLITIIILAIDKYIVNERVKNFMLIIIPDLILISAMFVISKSLIAL